MAMKNVELQEMSYTASEQVIERIAQREGVDPISLSPLYEVIDPDALDSLFSPTSTCDRRSGAVEFTYCGYNVSVSFDGDVVVGLNDHFETPSRERTYERNR